MSEFCARCGVALPPVRVSKCPMCGAPVVEEAAGAKPAATMLEPVADVRRLVERDRTQKTPEPPSLRAAKRDDTEMPLRPVRRPSTALLCIVDDDGESGEWIRLREERYVIGRSQGQIVIPNDGAMSGSHAEVGRALLHGKPVWYVKDLNSTNGTFARVTRGLLVDGQEFMVGAHRLKCDFSAIHAAAAPAPAGRQATQALSFVGSESIAKSQIGVTVVSGPEEGKRFSLAAGENWIGTDPACQIVLTDDKFVARRHAKIAADRIGKYFIEPGQCANGVWLRIKEVPVDGTAEFMLGEQRFILKAGK